MIKMVELEKFLRQPDDQVRRITREFVKYELPEYTREFIMSDVFLRDLLYTFKLEELVQKIRRGFLEGKVEGALNTEDFVQTLKDVFIKLNDIFCDIIYIHQCLVGVRDILAIVIEDSGASVVFPPRTPEDPQFGFDKWLEEQRESFKKEIEKIFKPLEEENKSVNPQSLDELYGFFNPLLSWFIENFVRSAERLIKNYERYNYLLMKWKEDKNKQKINEAEKYLSGAYEKVVAILRIISEIIKTLEEMLKDKQLISPSLKHKIELIKENIQPPQEQPNLQS